MCINFPLKFQREAGKRVEYKEVKIIEVRCVRHNKLADKRYDRDLTKCICGEDYNPDKTSAYNKLAKDVDDINIRLQIEQDERFFKENGDTLSDYLNRKPFINDNRGDIK